MKKLLCLLGGAMLLMNIQAQNNLAVSVGDTVPDILLQDILNYKSTSARLSDYKQPVIIDFFATWCAPCIEALPHLDSLQAEFGDSIQIFVVSHEPRATIEAFLENNHIGKTLRLAFIPADTTLKKYFPHVVIPHEVVISDGKVSAITSPENINKATIGKLCRSGQIELPLKRDIMNFDRHKPLFNNNIGKPLDLTIFQFLFTNYIDGLGSLVGRIFSADSSSKRIFYTNRLLLAYFFQAAGIQENYNRVVLEVPDVSKYILTTEKFEKWAKENCYCLEMIVPGSWTNEKIDSWMLKEFNQCLNVHISVEYRVVPCWVLNKVGENMVDPNKEISLDYQGTKEKQWINYNNPKSLKDSLKEYKFANLNRLMTALNMQKVGRPLVPIVLDETSDSSNMNISLRLKNIQDLPATSTALKKYGFKLEPALRKIKMLVIRE